MNPPVIIIGAGIAGLATALRLAAQHQQVVVLAGAALGRGSASAWAQGGVAAALAAADHPGLHAADTMRAGAGLVDAARAEQVTRNAAAQIAWLEKNGVAFDRTADGALALGREAAHGMHRIVHAGGDGTGAAIIKALVQAAKAAPGIAFHPGRHAVKLEMAAGRVVGVHTLYKGKGEYWPAAAVVLATGGLGQLYARTTNPLSACGEGLALAVRVGAACANLEFVQFHPTALAVAQDPMPLLTEALRGAGASLINKNGTRYMLAEHEQAELAPRDVVARATWRQLQAGLVPMLDARMAVGATFPQRFPLVYAACQEAGLDPITQPLPIAPAAHYHMGGVAVDGQGRSSLPGLWACGEVACTGLHGANRLASNSLLEALVYAEIIAADVAENHFKNPASLPAPAPPVFMPEAAQDDGAIRQALRQLMYHALGLVRDAPAMRQALTHMAAWHAAPQLGFTTRAMLLVGAMLTVSALQRQESRGAHSRSDYPETLANGQNTRLDLASFQQHFSECTDGLTWQEPSL